MAAGVSRCRSRPWYRSKGLLGGRKHAGPSHQDVLISLEILRMNEHKTQKTHKTHNLAPALNQARSFCLTLDKQNLLRPVGPTAMKMVDLHLLSLSWGGWAVTPGVKALTPCQGCQRKQSPLPYGQGSLKPPPSHSWKGMWFSRARRPHTHLPSAVTTTKTIYGCAHLSHSSVSHPKSKLQFHVTLNDFYSSLRFYSVKNPMRLHYLGHLPTG